MNDTDVTCLILSEKMTDHLLRAPWAPLQSPGSAPWEPYTTSQRATMEFDYSYQLTYDPVRPERLRNNSEVIEAMTRHRNTACVVVAFR